MKEILRKWLSSIVYWLPKAYCYSNKLITIRWAQSGIFTFLILSLDETPSSMRASSSTHSKICNNHPRCGALPVVQIRRADVASSSYPVSIVHASSAGDTRPLRQLAHSDANDVTENTSFTSRVSSTTYITQLDTARTVGSGKKKIKVDRVLQGGRKHGKSNYTSVELKCLFDHVAQV